MIFFNGTHCPKGKQFGLSAGQFGIMGDKMDHYTSDDEQQEEQLHNISMLILPPSVNHALCECIVWAITVSRTVSL